MQLPAPSYTGRSPKTLTTSPRTTARPRVTLSACRSLSHPAQHAPTAAACEVAAPVPHHYSSALLRPLSRPPAPPCTARSADCQSRCRGNCTSCRWSRRPCLRHAGHQAGTAHPGGASLLRVSTANSSQLTGMKEGQAGVHGVDDTPSHQTVGAWFAAPVTAR
jgi:hypothetical protein